MPYLAWAQAAPWAGYRLLHPETSFVATTEIHNAVVSSTPRGSLLLQSRQMEGDAMKIFRRIHPVKACRLAPATCSRESS